MSQSQSLATKLTLDCPVASTFPRAPCRTTWLASRRVSGAETLCRRCRHKSRYLAAAAIVRQSADMLALGSALDRMQHIARSRSPGLNYPALAAAGFVDAPVDDNAVAAAVSADWSARQALQQVAARRIGAAVVAAAEGSGHSVGYAAAGVVVVAAAETEFAARMGQLQPPLALSAIRSNPPGRWPDLEPSHFRLGYLYHRKPAQSNCMS